MNLGKVLVVDDVDAIREIIIFYLQSFAVVEIIEASSGADAINKFRQHPDIKLVISDQNMPNGTGSDLFFELRHDSQIPFVMHTTDTVELHDTLSKEFGFYYLPKPMELSKLESLFNVIVAKHYQNVGQEEVESYIPVRLSLIRKMGKTNVPLHIKISENKYVKILKEGEISKDFFIDRETQNQIHTLYIKQTDLHEYIHDFQKHIDETLDHPDKKLQATLEHALTTAELLKTVQDSIGISEEVEKIVSQNIAMVSNLTKEVAELKSIADDLENSDANPNAKHMILVSMIAISIGRHLNWISDKTSIKFVFAAILHDLFADESEHNSEIDKAHDEKSQKFRLHPAKAADLAEKWHACPRDVPIIIMQHHELPDGAGFPFGINSNRINPLSAVFIVAHDLALAFAKKGKLLSVKKWAAENKLKYHDGDFQKALTAVLELQRNSKNNSSAA